MIPADPYAFPFTPAHELPAEQALCVCGSVRLVLSISIQRFVVPADDDTFRHLKGSNDYAEALRKLQPHGSFVRDQETDLVEQSGYALRIFRSRLIRHHFFPTYTMNWTDAVLERLGSAAEFWQRWHVRVRFTRGGMVVVILDLPLDSVSLLECSELVLELPPGSANPFQQTQDQWHVGIVVLQELLAAIGSAITIEGTTHHSHQVRFGPTPQQLQMPRSDRYLIYQLHRISRNGLLVSPAEIKQHYAPVFAAFLEGALIKQGEHRRYAHYEPERAAALLANDKATWSEELCLLTGESALIYTPLVTTSTAYLGGPQGLDESAYRRHWHGIVRGIEQLVAFRSEAQQVERRTTELLSYVPHLTRRVNDGRLGHTDRRYIAHLAAGLSDIFDSLPELRSMQDSSALFQADYVRLKFEYLIDQLQLPETLELVNTNVDQLSFFLSYYNDMHLQWQSQQGNQLTLVLTVLLMFLALSSFLADTSQVLANRTQPIGPLSLGTWSLICLASLSIAVVVWQIWRFYRDR